MCHCIGRRRRRRPTRMSACLLVAVLAGMVTPVWSQDDTWRTGYPRWYDVVPPVAEEDPGVNTYWHDPDLGWRNDAACWFFGPADAGCPPQWFAHVDGLFLFRAPQGTTTFARLGPSGPDVLSTSAFDDEFSAAARATVGRSLGDWYRIEGTFFGTNTWSDSAFVRNLDANGGAGVGNLYSPFSNFGNPAAVVGLDYNDFASIEFSSRLTNFEVNVRRRLVAQPGVWESSFLVGARYIDLTESFGYRTTSTTPGPSVSSNDYRIGTKNQMIGVQLGFLTQFLVRPRMWINLELKGAMFANDASMDYTLNRVDAVGAATAFAGADQRNRTAFLGEIVLEYNYHFAPHWTFRAGYNAMWVTGVALAVDNFNSDINTLQLGPAQINHRGEVAYHGPHIGLTFAY